ncbi:F0F1 ATP synthase subunit B, partial [Neptuniibacter sp.]
MNINLTIIGQAIAFFIFVVFCMKYVWPPITAALAERKKKIAEGLDAADRAERDLQLAQEKATENMRKGKEE